MSNIPNPLSSPRFSFDQSKPFYGDLFNRKDLAVQLTAYLDRLRDGTVIALDAQWGEGKTWFGLNWAAQLKNESYRVIYLDAFQQDYVEDPFLLIASEINEAIGSDESVAEDLREKAAKVMKAILPLTTKVIINLATRFALGSSNSSDELKEVMDSTVDSTSDAAEKWLESKIDNHTKEKESLESFRNALKDYCESQDKPVVFFIDELDRCKPTFAIKLIERLKHFFDVPNLIFVLLLNNGQLENAVKGVYGAETDASGYLRKFVHFNLKLPKNSNTENESTNASWIYLRTLSNHYKFSNDQVLYSFIKSFSVFSSLMDMSLRDLEKGMALLALNGVNQSTEYMAWPISLKLKRLDIFNGLLVNDIKAHAQAIELLESINPSEYSNFWIKKYFLPYHIIRVHGRGKLTEEQNKDYEHYKPNGYYGGKEPLIQWLEKLDLVSLDR